MIYYRNGFVEYYCVLTKELRLRDLKGSRMYTSMHPVRANRGVSKLTREPVLFVVRELAHIPAAIHRCVVLASNKNRVANIGFAFDDTVCSLL
jgi:hypothetical protein